MDHIRFRTLSPKMMLIENKKYIDRQNYNWKPRQGYDLLYR